MMYKGGVDLNHYRQVVQGGISSTHYQLQSVSYNMDLNKTLTNLELDLDFGDISQKVSTPNSGLSLVVRRMWRRSGKRLMRNKSPVVSLTMRRVRMMMKRRREICLICDL